ncbi:MAG TPA: hemerythrin domain-containing protein [Caldimonas sp.]|nr:hemerythrin domain-containing protein [Caldimonas sp.]
MADHREMRALADRYRSLVDAAADAAERDAVGEELCELLIVHATLEEELLYPAAAAAGVDPALIDAQEPVRVREAIARVRALPAGDRQRAPYVLALVEAATRHAQQEEAVVFPACREASIDLDALGARLNERQADLLVDREGRAEPAEANGLADLVRKVFG